MVIIDQQECYKFKLWLYDIDGLNATAIQSHKSVHKVTVSCRLRSAKQLYLNTFHLQKHYPILKKIDHNFQQKGVWKMRGAASEVGSQESGRQLATSFFLAGPTTLAARLGQESQGVLFQEHWQYLGCLKMPETAISDIHKDPRHMPHSICHVPF